MFEANQVLIFASFVLGSLAAVCEDVDTKACELLAIKRPDLCSDADLSAVCTRFCGRCPVKCYQCPAVDDPSNCTHLVACPSMDHYCFTTQTFTNDFSEVYKMGCAEKSKCQQYFGPENRKRNVDVNGACCTTDNCNNQLPLVILSQEIPPTPSPSNMSVNTTADPNACENLDDVACHRLKSSSNLICSKDGLSSNICPRMCGKCFNCYTCNDINNVDDCNSTNVCHSGHECFTLETLSADLKPVYRVGCIEEQLCARFKASTANIFGRRDGFALKGGCCKTDLCNDQFEKYHPTTTHKPTNPCVHNHRHCPTGYTTSSSTCVMIGQHKMTWYESKQFCASHCGRLVDFSSFHDMQHIFASLVPHSHGHYTDTRVWTDAHYVHHKWIWNHNGQSIDRSQFRHLSTTHTNNHGCGFAVVHTNKTTTEDLIPTDCTKDHLPLCEAIRT
ncbi:Hypothetical predicted protein [Mytilus galloprovincialis]|uniref:C-type lectin domain-containing protein n=1 Tax=Mytilus galloprovincialis TaxID=29158 RepID=A0A8B6DEG5_MYTGA|nr:Hypothetical predicted protein [Mytilus galloprovincialis]